jgi:hypothetical protein
MSAKSNKKRKVGRPASGNKGFCIRMQAATYKDLCRAAETDGYKRLGDWLDHRFTPLLHQIHGQLDETESPDKMEKQFLLHSAEAAKAISKLRVIIGHDHRFTDSEGKRKSMQHLNLEITMLFQLLDDIGVDLDLIAP